MPAPESSPFANAAYFYRAAGWDCPVPLGRPNQRNAKSPVPSGFTGHAAIVPDDDQIDEWVRTHAHNNIGLHLPDGFIGIDVDHYDKGSRTKRGADTIAEYESQLGPLPSTIRTSARGDDNPSGIRIYRVPKGLEFVTKIGADVEIIQAKHRYALVWPSMHPDTHTVYMWYGTEQHVPDTDQAARLPPEWVAALAVNATKGLNKDAGLVAESEVRNWLRARQGRGRCRAMTNVCAREAALLTDADSGSRYDTARDAVMALVRLSAEGHHGVTGAVAELRGVYEDAVAGEAHRDRSEWARQVIGAVSAVMGTEVELHGAVCPDRARETSDAEWPAPGDPYAVAEEYLTRYAQADDGGCTLRFWRGLFWTWTGTHWRRYDEATLESHLYAVLADAVYIGASEQMTLLRWKPDKTKIGRIVHAISRHALVHLDENFSYAAPDGVTEIACANGVLAVRTNGKRELLPHSPARFNLSAMDFDYNPAAPEPREWYKFLDSLATADDMLDLLQEWFAYVISGDVSKQKMLLLLGPTRAGKGVITRVLQRLVSSYASPSLDDFATNFGLGTCIGKSLITVNDARFGGGRSKAVIEKLLNITGGDSVQIDRKNKDPWEGPLSGRLMIVSNELPSLSGEASSALANRFLIVELSQSFLDREDEDLENRVRAELSGILLWALEGLDALVRQGRFTVPASARVVRRELVQSLNPLEAFLDDCCEVVEGFTSTERLYEAYRRWCDRTGRYAPTDRMKFGRDLRQTRPGAITPTRVRVNGALQRGFDGVVLNESVDTMQV